MYGLHTWQHGARRGAGSSRPLQSWARLFDELFRHAKCAARVCTHLHTPSIISAHTSPLRILFTLRGCTDRLTCYLVFLCAKNSVDLFVVLILPRLSGAFYLASQRPRWEACRALWCSPGAQRTATDLPRGAAQKNCEPVATGAIGGGPHARDARMHAAHSACRTTGGAILRLRAL